MQKTANMRNSLLRKTSTIVFLPLITFIWITGWALTRKGDSIEHREISQKTLRTKPRFEADTKEFKVSDEDSRIANEQQIYA